MAVSHAAFVFQPTVFHKHLKEAIVKRQGIDDRLFLQAAKESVARGGGISREYLRRLCYDEEWFETSEVKRFTEWYLALLGAHVTAAQYLSNVSFAAIELALPVLGWNERALHLLLVGRWLHSLVDLAGVAELSGRCGVGLRHVSWLSPEDVANLSFDLVALAPRLRSPDRPVVDTLAGLPNEFRGKVSPAEILRQSYQEVTSRLDAALSSRGALLLINDVNSYQQRPGPDPV